MVKSYKAFLFDFDYTLGDSTKGIVLSVNHALGKLGYPAGEEAEIKRTIGLSLKDTYYKLVQKKEEKEAEKFAAFFIEKADEVMVDSTVLYPDVKELLGTLKKEGYKVGIVTTKFRYRIEKILAKFDALHLVDLIVGADDVKKEKPDPEGLLFAIQKLELKKEDVLYVGDSLVDAKTAENAGVDFAGVLTGMTTREEFENYRNVFIGENVGENIILCFTKNGKSNC